MTPLRQRMLDDMRVRNLSPNTQQLYMDRVAKFAQYFGKSPELLGPEDIRTYQVYLISQKRASSSMLQQTVCALRFLYRTTLGKEWTLQYIPFPKQEKKLPVVLSQDEISRFLESLPNLKHDIEVFPAVANTYADASDDLIRTVNNASSISRSIVDEQQNLDALLVSATGLADLGNEVLGDNRQGLADAVHVLLPTTSLLAKYHENVACGLAGIIPFATSPPLPVPGVLVSVSFLLGIERYRFPQDLPRVNAKLDRPICKEMGLPNVPYEYVPPMLVADVGANPWRYGNQGILLNSDGLKQFLFGPIDGPPRNSPQIGMPG